MMKKKKKKNKRRKKKKKKNLIKLFLQNLNEEAQKDVQCNTAQI